MKKHVNKEIFSQKIVHKKQPFLCKGVFLYFLQFFYFFTPNRISPCCVLISLRLKQKKFLQDSLHGSLGNLESPFLYIQLNKPHKKNNVASVEAGDE